MAMLRYLPLTLLLGTLSLGAAAQEPSGTLVVANRDGGSVSFFDVETATELARLPIGPRIPHEIAISPDGELALTSEYGTGDRPGRTLLVIHVPTATYLGEIDLGPESRPHSFDFLPDGRHAVATMEGSGEIALVDVVARSVARTFPTGGDDSHMVRVGPDGARAYVTSRGGDGTLSVVDLSGENETVVIETGPGAEGLAVSPDGGEVWVVNRLDASISIVDTETLAVRDVIEAPPFAGRVEISEAGRVLVPNGSFAGNDAAQALTLYSLETRAQTARHEVRSAEQSGGGFGVHIHEELAFVSDRTSGAITIYDLENFPESRTLTMDHESPDGLGFSPHRLDVLEED